MVETTVETKRCTGPCGLEKSLNEFHKNCKSPDGHKTKCKTCILEARRATRPTSVARELRSPEHLTKLRELKATAVEGTKPCTNCLTVKPLSDFHDHAGFRDGKQSWCSTCMNEDQKAKGRGRRYKWTYGLTIEQYDKMLEQQGGCCAICGATEPGGSNKHFAVDHDHTIKVVRGLLCASCNMGIGQLGDSPERLKQAACYLQSFTRPEISSR